jgi:hypothetical protein
MSSQAVLI